MCSASKLMVHSRSVRFASAVQALVAISINLTGTMPPQKASRL